MAVNKPSVRRRGPLNTFRVSTLRSIKCLWSALSQIPPNPLSISHYPEKKMDWDEKRQRGASLHPILHGLFPGGGREGGGAEIDPLRLLS